MLVPRLDGAAEFQVSYSSEALKTLYRDGR